MMRHRLLLVVMLAALSARTPRALGGCQYDTQCKGERVCEKGVCVAPAGQENPAIAPAPGGSWIADQRTAMPSLGAFATATGVDPVVGGLYEGPCTRPWDGEWFTDGKSAEVDHGEWRAGDRPALASPTRPMVSGTRATIATAKRPATASPPTPTAIATRVNVRDGQATGHGIYT